MATIWIGLDYTVVFKWLERHPQEDEDDFWWALKVLEVDAVNRKNKAHAHS